jgi:hypothetical protein
MDRPTLTRRQVALCVAVPLLPALAQQQAPDKGSSPEEILARAKADAADATKQLGEFPLPMATEPSFVFKP